MCGVNTNIVTIVAIDDGGSSDVTNFIPPLKHMALSFPIRELSADAIYSTYKIVEAETGATSFIAMKSGTSANEGAPSGTYSISTA